MILWAISTVLVPSLERYPVVNKKLQKVDAAESVVSKWCTVWLVLQITILT